MSQKYPTYTLFALVGGVIILVLSFFGFFTEASKRALRTSKEPLEDWRKSARTVARRTRQNLRGFYLSVLKKTTGKAIVTVRTVQYVGCCSWLILAAVI